MTAIRNALRARDSIAARVAGGAALVLAVFLLASALALDSAFRDSAERARQERLLAQVFMLMAATEVDERGQPVVAEGRLDPALNLPASGLHAALLDAQGAVRWRSGSSMDAPAQAFVGAQPLAPGEKAFDIVPGAAAGQGTGIRTEAGKEAAAADGTGPDAGNGSGPTRLLRQRFGVRWAVGQGAAVPLTFMVQESAAALDAALAGYRRMLWAWLGPMAVLLLAAQAWVLRWGLRPLCLVARDLDRLEAGERARLELPAAAELRPLAGNLNALLEREHRRQTRYRDALADLAHALKTPLALLDARLREPDVPPPVQQALRDQALQMGRVVDYHLQRAAAAGPRQLGPHRPLRPEVARVASALGRVHADRAPAIEVAIDPAWSVRLDEGDLTEMLGNLVDNACKWCRARVVIRGLACEGRVGLAVDDDGPGIDAAVGQRVLARGVRADESTPGHGIGLAVVREIAEASGGTVAIGRAPLGGARVALWWPASSPALSITLANTLPISASSSASIGAPIGAPTGAPNLLPNTPPRRSDDVPA